jgi:hypothetical protein
MQVKRIRRYVPVVVVGRGSEGGNVALRAFYEGICLTGFFKLCVGGVNGKLEKGLFFAGGLLENELTFLVEGLNELLFIGG